MCLCAIASILNLSLGKSGMRCLGGSDRISPVRRYPSVFQGFCDVARAVDRKEPPWSPGGSTRVVKVGPLLERTADLVVVLQ